MMHVLFYTRLLLYLVTVAIPFLHPAIIVPYDLPSIGLWFVIVPAMFLLSFYLSPPRLKLRYWIGGALVFLIIASLVLGGFSFDGLSIFLTGLAAFLLTALVFKTQGKGRVAATLEIFFTGGLYYAFLNFSRSSEEIARASAGVIKVLFILAILVFFIHAVVLFIASFPKVVSGKGKRNVLVFLVFLLPLGLVLSLLLPADFIIHEVEINPLNEELDRQSRLLDENGNPPLDGNLRGRTLRDRDGRLEGMDPEKWKNLKMLGRGSGAGRQYALMIVASKRDPLYLGSAYNGDLDAVRGFVLSKDESLNELSTMRLIESWQNPAPDRDRARSPVSVAIFSALSERYFAYRPLVISPTILNEAYRPFAYSYEGLFSLSNATPEMLLGAGRLSPAERRTLSRYLDIPFSGKVYDAFKAYTDGLISPRMSDLERIAAILKGFQTFQYELGYNEDVRTARMLDFLENTKTGDCTEFANTTAILARFAGVPSRVVTGYLASKGLQLPKHVKGLYYLREHMEPLQKFGLDELLLVTTSHRHAWTQVYIAGYGWIDIETTTFAIPPQLGGDPNDWNLVVPFMEKERGKIAAETPFPWLTVLLVSLCVIGGIVVGVYLFRFTREFILYLVSRGGSLAALRALKVLVLIRLATRGFAFKPPSQTLLEYAERCPLVTGFATVYTELRYRVGIPAEERKRLMDRLREEYREVKKESLKTVRGFRSELRRLLTLRGFLY